MKGLNMRCLFPVLCAIVFSYPGIAAAETVILKSGRRIDGAIIEKTDTYVKLDCGGTGIYYETKYIDSILPDGSSQGEMPEGSYLDRGLALANAGQLEAAEEMFMEGTGNEPENGNCHGALNIIRAVKEDRITREYALSLLKGSYYLKKQEYGAAISHLQDALRAAPGDADVCYNLAGAYAALGESALAVKYLGRTLEARPEDVDVYCVLGKIYYCDGEYAKARDNFVLARELLRKRGESEKAADIQRVIDGL